MQTDVVCYMCTWCRNLPLSIVISVSAITVLYVFTNFSYFVVLGIHGVLQSDTVAMVCLPSFSCMLMNYARNKELLYRNNIMIATLSYHRGALLHWYNDEAPRPRSALFSSGCTTNHPSIEGH